MNLSLLDTKIIQLINQYSINGSLTPFSNGTLQDYLLRTRNLIDACQKEIAQKKKITETKKITQSFIPNQIITSNTSQHLDADILFSAIGSKSYYFEVDAPGTITIEVNGVIQSTISSNVTEFTAFSGLITSIPTDNIVIRFSGAYPYNIQNVALYAYTFASADYVPQSRKYNKYPFPSNFMELENIKIENSYGYTDLNDYHIEDSNIYINSSLYGVISINYFKYPTTITIDTNPNTELEITADAQEIIPYYVAGYIYLEDNQTVSTMLLNTYQTKLNSLTMPAQSKQSSISNTWGW